MVMGSLLVKPSGRLIDQRMKAVYEGQEGTNQIWNENRRISGEVTTGASPHATAAGLRPHGVVNPNVLDETEVLLTEDHVIRVDATGHHDSMTTTHAPTVTMTARTVKIGDVTRMTSEIGLGLRDPVAFHLETHLDVVLRHLSCRLRLKYQTKSASRQFWWTTFW